MPIVAKLDELGKPAWIALMILGFFIWWPLGLATLAFIIGRGRIPYSNGRGMSRWWGPADQIRPAGTWWQPSPRPSGNRAFDEYRQDTLRRLEEEEREFQEFLRSSPDGEGQGGVRSVHGRASHPQRYLIVAKL